MRGRSGGCSELSTHRYLAPHEALFRRGCDVVTRLVPISSELWGGSLPTPEKRLRPNLSAGVVDTAMRPPESSEMQASSGAPCRRVGASPRMGRRTLVVDVGLPYEIVTGLHGPGEERYFSVGSILEASEVVETIE